ncbi:MAG: hypothetical protein NTW86_32770, partial [Candidatus Sumerlaeota bacterium]|nr:hypothetical protein [Candidatus Sumerlaeota bacterium]
NYRKYRIGPDTKEWAQAVFNWAIPEVRDQKFALIRELCQKYDIDGMELDFLRHWSYFRLDETTSKQRREIMTGFVRRVREALDATARAGRRRWLCVRVPALLACHDQLGIDLASMVAAGVDMVNLSASYYTTQATDLPRIRAMTLDAALFLEMTHTTLTGKGLAGSGTQPFLRTTDQQFYTTAHLAYAQGADGVSLFNFVYYRDHKIPELGPFNEPPFHVLPKLKDPDWLARQPQWHFLSGFSIKPPIKRQTLPTKIEQGQERVFSMAMAPTRYQTCDGLLRLRAEGEIGDRNWRVSANGVELAPTAYVRKPLDHPYEGYLGEPGEHACFTCPRSAVRSGDNEIRVAFTQGETVKLIYLDLTLP